VTKLRTPLTFADAMTRVAGAIGWAEAARVTRRSDRTLRAWSDPELTPTPPIALALDLDAAFRAAGGDGAPFQEAYDFQLDVARERQDACRHALAADIAVVARELGQAVAAAMALLQSSASSRDVHRAFAEVAEAAAALDALQLRLASFLPPGVGLDAGKAGGPQ